MRFKRNKSLSSDERKAATMKVLRTTGAARQEAIRDLLDSDVEPTVLLAIGVKQSEITAARASS